MTIIELLVVVAVVSILAGLAILQYNSYRLSSYNSTAETDLRNLVTYEISFLTGYETYVSFNVEEIDKDGIVEKTVTLPDGSTETFRFQGFSSGVAGCVKVKDEKFANTAVKHKMGTRYIGYDFENGIFFNRKGSMGDELENGDVPEVIEKSISEWSGWDIGIGKH